MALDGSLGRFNFRQLSQNRCRFVLMKPYLHDSPRGSQADGRMFPGCEQIRERVYCTVNEYLNPCHRVLKDLRPRCVTTRLEGRLCQPSAQGPLSHSAAPRRLRDRPL